MFKTKIIAAAIGLAAMAYAGNAGAVTIEFTGIGGLSSPGTGCPYTEAGYSFTCTGNHTDAVNSLSWHDGGANPGNNDIFMTRIDGFAFDILSLDVLSGSPFSIITTAGTFVNPGVGTNIAVNLLGILTAKFAAGNDFANIDNINAIISAPIVTAPPVVSAVPEPGTLAIFGLGLAGLGFARRKSVA